MKIERDNGSYYIYDYTSVVFFDTIYQDIKELFQRFQKRLGLNGFYRVVVSLKKIGVFMEVIKIEDAFYKDTLDLKIEVKDSLDVYYSTEDYFLVKDFSIVRYFEGKYYALVDDSFDELFEKVEFGDFVFGKKLDSILCNSVVI